MPPSDLRDRAYWAALLLGIVLMLGLLAFALVQPLLG